MSTETKTFHLGIIEHAKRVIFREMNNPASVYVYPTREQTDAEGTTLLHGLHIEDDEGEWFAFWEETSHWPAVYVIRAKSFEAALDVFMEEFSDPLDDGTLADYAPDDSSLYYYNRWIDDKSVACVSSSELVQGCELVLESISL